MFRQNGRKVGAKVGNKKTGIHLHSFEPLVIDDEIRFDFNFRKAQGIIQVLGIGAQRCAQKAAGKKHDCYCNTGIKEVNDSFCWCNFVEPSFNFVQQIKQKCLKIGWSQYLMIFFVMEFPSFNVKLAK